MPAIFTTPDCELLEVEKLDRLEEEVERLLSELDDVLLELLELDDWLLLEIELDELELADDDWLDSEDGDELDVLILLRLEDDVLIELGDDADSSSGGYVGVRSLPR